ASSPAPTIVTTTSEGRTITINPPQSRAEFEGLLSRRDELTQQLESTVDSRGELNREIMGTPSGVAKVGLEQRLVVLDRRVLQIEEDLSRTSEQIANTPGQFVGRIVRRENTPDDQFQQGMAAGTFSTLLAVLVINAFRRYRRRHKSPGQTGDTVTRQIDSPQVERLEHSMEAIAIEVERISEGQRFVTRLLSESANRPPVTSRVEGGQGLG
ncbi:MAG: hypothetical protein ABIS03_13335, partial [Gemmatimonadaceae bacterium]